MNNTASKESKSVRILNLLASAGEQGMRFVDIQWALWDMTYADNDDMSRGYWCTNLLGGRYYHAGLLRYFADKGPDGRWRRNKRCHYGHPWRWLAGARH
jgi:hypothetical protein